MKAEYLLHRNTTINVQQQKNNPLQLLELIYSIQQTSRQSRELSNSEQQPIGLKSPHTLRQDGMLLW